MTSATQGVTLADAVGALLGPDGDARQAAHRSLRFEVEAVVQQLRAPNVPAPRH